MRQVDDDVIERDALTIPGNKMTIKLNTRLRIHRGRREYRNTFDQGGWDQQPLMSKRTTVCYLNLVLRSALPSRGQSCPDDAPPQTTRQSAANTPTITQLRACKLHVSTRALPVQHQHEVADDARTCSMSTSRVARARSAKPQDSVVRFPGSAATHSSKWR